MAPKEIPSSGRPAQEEKKAAKSIHTGHRKKMKELFLRYGGSQMDEYQRLELMLYYAIPQGDVNPVVMRLMHQFGSLRGVLDATPEALTQVSGVSSHTAALLTLFQDTFIWLQKESSKKMERVISLEEAIELLRPYFIGARTEVVYLLSLDDRGCVLGCDLITEGTAGNVLLDQRKIVETAILRRASQVYLAHCHPYGLISPSQEDISATGQLQRLLNGIGIFLSDHLIFADGDCCSLVRRGLMQPYGALQTSWEL